MTDPATKALASVIGESGTFAGYNDLPEKVAGSDSRESNMLINKEKYSPDSIPSALRDAERRMTAETRRKLFHRFVSALDFLPYDHLRIFPPSHSGIIEAVPESGRWRQLPLMGCGSAHLPGKGMPSDPDFAPVEDIFNHPDPQETAKVGRPYQPGRPPLRSLSTADRAVVLAPACVR